ncbi:hypothetical protein GS941_26990 [Rhodococcus hoagii]|nr:hypothetical protein [Prescottella equi]
MTAAVDDAEEIPGSFESDPPDGAVLDVRMPPTFNQRGTEGGDRGPASAAGVPRVVLSAYVEDRYAG